MKKISFPILIAVLFAGCYKAPNYDQLNANFIVWTNFDSAVNFKDYKTFVMPPYVGLISNTSEDSILDPQYGDTILSLVSNNLTARGYTQVPE